MNNQNGGRQMTYRIAGLVVATALLATPAVTAASEEHDKFSGRVGFGAMVIDSGNNLNPKGSKAFIDDLGSPADRETTVLPLVIPHLIYDIGQKDGLTLYLDTRPPIEEVGGFAIGMGGAYQFEKVGTLDIGLFFTPLEEAYRNPYATKVERLSTDTSKYGVSIALNRIMGTGLHLNAVYMGDDVDDDDIGALEPELARDGAVYALKGNYGIFLSKALEIRPGLSLRRGEYDGESQSFVKYKADLELRYAIGKLMLMPRLTYSHSEYDEIHPIFNKTRADDSYGVSVMASLMAPLGFDNLSIQLLLAYREGTSNIAFYESESRNCGLFLSYHF